MKSLIVSEPFRVPVVVGLNATPMVHRPPAGKLDLQVLLLILKSPLVLMLVMPNALVAGLVLLNVTFLAELVVPTICGGKVNDAAVRAGFVLKPCATRLAAPRTFSLPVPQFRFGVVPVKESDTAI